MTHDDIINRFDKPRFDLSNNLGGRSSSLVYKVSRDAPGEDNIATRRWFRGVRSLFSYSHQIARAYEEPKERLRALLPFLQDRIVDRIGLPSVGDISLTSQRHVRMASYAVSSARDGMINISNFPGRDAPSAVWLVSRKPLTFFALYESKLRHEMLVKPSTPHAVNPFTLGYCDIDVAFRGDRGKPVRHLLGHVGRAPRLNELASKHALDDVLSELQRNALYYMSEPISEALVRVSLHKSLRREGYRRRTTCHSDVIITNDVAYPEPGTLPTSLQAHIWWVRDHLPWVERGDLICVANDVWAVALGDGPKPDFLGSPPSEARIQERDSHVPVQGHCAQPNYRDGCFRRLLRHKRIVLDFRGGPREKTWWWLFRPQVQFSHRVLSSFQNGWGLSWLPLSPILLPPERIDAVRDDEWGNFKTIGVTRP